MKKLFPILLLLTACVGPTPYVARKADESRFGYSDQQLDGAHYRVIFTGNSQTPRETVENYLLYRAAELTVASGNAYFIVVEHDTDKNTSYTGFAEPGLGNGFGRGPGLYGGYGYPGWYGGAVIEETPTSQYAADLTMMVVSGAKPDDKSAYDAKDVLKTLGPAIVRPQDRK